MSGNNENNKDILEQIGALLWSLLSWLFELFTGVPLDDGVSEEEETIYTADNCEDVH